MDDTLLARAVSYGQQRESLVHRVRRDGPASADWWLDDNQTQLYTHDKETLTELVYHDILVEYIFMYVYILVAVIGVTANGMVLVRMFTTPKLRSPSNYFITNLAASDLLVLLVLMTTRIVTTYLPGYYSNMYLTKTVSYVQHVCIQSTALILAAMSYMRYHFIVHPLKARAEWTSRMVWTICGLIWIVSCILYTPLWFGVLYIEGNTATDLIPIPLQRKIFSTLRLFPMFVFPGFVILLSYGRIVTTFRRRDDILQGRSFQADASFQRKTDLQARKLTRMVILIIMVFFLSWGPYQFCLSGLDLRPYTLPKSPRRWRSVVITFASLRLLVFCGSAINPFIYAYANPAFLKIKKLKFICSSRETTSSAATLETRQTPRISLEQPGGTYVRNGVQNNVV